MIGEMRRLITLTNRTKGEGPVAHKYPATGKAPEVWGNKLSLGHSHYSLKQFCIGLASIGTGKVNLPASFGTSSFPGMVSTYSSREGSPIWNRYLAIWFSEVHIVLYRSLCYYRTGNSTIVIYL